MRASTIAFLIASMVLVNQAPPTVRQVLGEEQTRSILKAAIAASVAQASDTYLLTDKSIEALKKAEISELVLLNLSNSEELKDKEIVGKKIFLRAVSKAIGEEEARRYKDVILVNTQGYLILNEQFEIIVTGEVLHAKAPSKNVREWLERNFRRFLSGYVLYLKDKSEIKNRLISHERFVDAFLKLQAAKCGEIPCAGVPPCCGDLCDPCRN